MEKHKAIIKYNINRKMYHFGWNHTQWYGAGERPEYEVYEYYEHLKEETLWEGELDSPLLNRHDEIYIEELNLKVSIDSRLRSTSGAYIYFADYETEAIEDEVTAESLRVAQAKEKEFTASRTVINDTTESKKISWFSKLFK